MAIPTEILTCLGGAITALEEALKVVIFLKFIIKMIYIKILT